MVSKPYRSVINRFSCMTQNFKSCLLFMSGYSLAAMISIWFKSVS